MDRPQAAPLVAAPTATVRVPTRAAPAPAVRWVVPSWRDPRIPFAVILALYAALGATLPVAGHRPATTRGRAGLWRPGALL